MLEPIVQDYVEAALKLPCQAFCQQLDVPVLVAIRPELDPSFQSAPTRMLDEQARALLARGVRLDHRARVLELRPRRPNRLGQVTLGRSEENDVVLADETVSGRHAIFAPDPATGRPTLQDQESTNGSLLNGQALLPWRNALLGDGDTLSLGDAVFLFYTPAGLYAALRQLMGG